MIAKPDPPHLIRRRYRLEQWLGQGSIGTTYRAYDQELDRQVVIKFLDKGERGEQDPETHSDHLLHKAQTIANLSHPNLVSIYDMGREQGWEYLVLEFISGGDLRTLLHQHGGTLSQAKTISIAENILQALTYANQQGITHHNLKPENILLTPAGQVKVTDFCLRGNASDSSRSDLYALGCICYELLIGQYPFKIENTSRATFETLPKLNAQILPLLEQFVLRLLNAESDLCFANTKQALNELTKIKDRPLMSQTDKPSIWLIGASNDLATALEADRRQLAGQLQARIIDPLKLLLTQASTFEETLPKQPSAARTAVSILSSLARQILQQADDLEDSLRPAVLETLGLEPALEALATRYRRSHNIQLDLQLIRLSRRPTPTIELALFRLIQDFLENLHNQNQNQATLKITQEDDFLILDLHFPITLYLSEAVLTAMRRKLEPFGGQLSLGRTSQGQAHMRLHVALQQEIHFTPKEKQVLDALMLGLSNKEIARQLSISPRTVNYHLNNIFSKLGVHSRTEAAVIASRQDLARRD